MKAQVLSSEDVGSIPTPAPTSESYDLSINRLIKNLSNNQKDEVFKKACIFFKNSILEIDWESGYVYSGKTCVGRLTDVEFLFDYDYVYDHGTSITTHVLCAAKTQPYFEPFFGDWREFR